MRTLLSISLLSVALAETAAADLIEKSVSQLRLRPQVAVRGDAVTLADVVDFTRADPRLLSEIGDQPVMIDLRAPAVTEITHDQVVDRLEELGVNLARVLVSGSLACRVTLEPLDPQAARPGAAPEPPPLRRQTSAGGSMTLAEVLQAQVEDELASAGGAVEVEFELAGEEFLELTTPPFDFSVRGNHGSKLGLREFSVTIRRDGRTQRTVKIAARVKLVKQVLVAARPLNIGGYVKRSSLDYATRIFTSGDELGLDHPEQVIGQRVKSFVPAGQMVRRSDFQSVDLVKRSQPVTVIGSVADSGAVSVRITGDALDSGGYGDMIRVRLGDSRATQREVRGVVSGVGLVRLTDGGL